MVLWTHRTDVDGAPGRRADRGRNPAVRKHLRCRVIVMLAERASHCRVSLLAGFSYAVLNWAFFSVSGGTSRVQSRSDPGGLIRCVGCQGT
jgi:hypothetical protein